MKEHPTRMLFAAVAFAALAALLAGRAHARIPEDTDPPFTFRTVVAQPVDPSLFAGRTRAGRFALRVPLRATVHSNGSRLFVWPGHGTSAYKRAAGMALHGDPEAQSFVSGRTDVNPFDAQ